jgi:hypothetical protein
MEGTFISPMTMYLGLHEEENRAVYKVTNGSDECPSELSI